MSIEDSLPKFRYATFCKMVLVDQTNPADLTIVGVMNALNARLELPDDYPDVLDFIVQPLALYASFESPKNKEACEVTVQLSSPDMPLFHMNPTGVEVPFGESGAEFGNLTVRMDGLRIKVPTRDGRYKIVAKWKAHDRTLGTLDFAVNVELVNPDKSVKRS